jgi:altronate dehydratase small subunit
MPLSAIVIDPRDNVATSVRTLPKGEKIRISIGGRQAEVELREEIPCGHKLALSSIETGSPVIKYGERIGLATRQIAPGEHVHVHNVEGLKGRGDKI